MQGRQSLGDMRTELQPHFCLLDWGLAWSSATACSEHIIPIYSSQVLILGHEIAPKVGPKPLLQSFSPVLITK